MTSTSTMDSTVSAQGPTRDGSPFRLVALPREHGATVAFSLSAALALALAMELTAGLCAAVALMTLVMFSLHRPLQALAISLVGACAILLLWPNEPRLFLLGLPVLTMGAGAVVLLVFTKKMQFALKQSLSMAAVSILPLAASVIQSGLDAHILAKALLFCASTLVSTAMVQIASHSRTMTPLYSVLGVLALTTVALSLGQVNILLLAAPFALQALWLRLCPKPSFKALGICETVCLLWCAVVLYIH